MAKSRWNERRVGRRVSMVSLTKSGEKFIGNVPPRHSKLVKSFMRALDAREQDTLSRICRKLRAGDVLKFMREIRMEDPECRTYGAPEPRENEAPSAKQEFDVQRRARSSLSEVEG